MKNWKLLFFVLAGIGACLMFISTAESALIETSAEYHIAANISPGGYVYSPQLDIIDSDTGSGDIDSEVSFGDQTYWGSPSSPKVEAYARAAGTDANYVAATASYLGWRGYNTTATSASVIWKGEKIADFSGEQTWDFNISAGMLGLTDNFGADSSMLDTPTASYDFSILINDEEMFSTGATYKGGLLGLDYTERGTDIGGHYSYDSVNLAYLMSYAPYSGSIAIGTFSEDATIDITMRLVVEASGFAYETGALAYFGDPGDLSGGGTNGIYG